MSQKTPNLNYKTESPKEENQINKILSMVDLSPKPVQQKNRSLESLTSKKIILKGNKNGRILYLKFPLDRTLTGCCHSTMIGKPIRSLIYCDNLNEVLGFSSLEEAESEANKIRNYINERCQSATALYPIVEKY